MKKSNIQFLTKRWHHHTASGGYDRLARELGGDVVHRNEKLGVVGRVLSRMWWRTTKTGDYLIDYRYGDLRAERRVLARAIWQRPAAVHVLYGDEQLDLLLRRRSLLPCPLVATFHFPTNRVRHRFEDLQKNLVTKVDAAVVVSRSQLEDFKRWLGPGKVVYVPHGIDTERFCPGPASKVDGRERFVVVGEHMRDWAATHRIIDECNARKLPVEFDVVAREEYWPHFTGCANTRLHTRISEEELIALYRNATALLVPVTDSTANNAVLESLACGTPVISNAVGGIPDYVDETCGWLFEKGEVTGIVKLIAEMCARPETASALKEAARRKALEFSWARVAEQMQVVYEAAATGNSPATAVAAWQQNPRLATAPVST